MKRRKGTLFDALEGVGELREGSGSGRGRKSFVRRDFRLSGRQVLLYGCVAFAIVALAYYLGTFHGATDGLQGRLLRMEADPDIEGPPSGPGRDAITSRPYYSVRAMSGGYRDARHFEAVRAEMASVYAALAREGFEDLELVQVADGDQGDIILYVGRAAEASELEPVKRRLRRLKLGSSRGFPGAYVTRRSPLPPATGNASE